MDDIKYPANVRWVTVDELRELFSEVEYIPYPEEVRFNLMEDQLRREMAKGRVYGHFC